MYCKPKDVRAASEPRAVASKLGRLFNALENLIDRDIVEGKILDDIAQVRERIFDGLEAEGWTVSFVKARLASRNRAHVYPPGSSGGKRVRKWREELNP